MTAIVGIRQGSEIVIASDGTSIAGNDKDPFDNQKIFRPDGSGRVLVAFSGTRSLLGALEGERNFFGNGKDLSFLKMVNVIVPKLFAFCEKGHFLSKDSDGYLSMIGSFLISTPSSLFRVDPYGTVRVIDGFCAFGFGGSVAMASLLATEGTGLSPSARAIQAVKTAIKLVPGLGYPVYFGEDDQKTILCLPDQTAVDKVIAEDGRTSRNG
jgi:ATP-dependent protease HslVU (ClpYQ) peptidase subunit